MKKIIIFSDTDKPRDGLVSCLKALFPECEIQILKRRSESIEKDLIASATVFNLKRLGKSVT